MKVEGVISTAGLVTAEGKIRRMEGKIPEELIPAAEMTGGKREEGQEDQQAVEKGIELLNETMKRCNTELRFTLHEKSGEYIVKVIDTRDNYVIREIPSERVLDMVAYFEEVLGVMLDKFI